MTAGCFIDLIGAGFGCSFKRHLGLNLRFDAA